MDLIRLQLREPPVDGTTADVERLVAVAKARGYAITLGEARRAWEQFSAGRAASWLGMEPESDQSLWAAVEDYFEEAP